ncbi:unnamed protein product, partial [Prorocentrum cordatum]
VTQITTVLNKLTEKMGVESQVAVGKPPKKRTPKNTQVPPTLQKIREYLKYMRVNHIKVTEEQVQDKLRGLLSRTTAASTWLNGGPAAEKAQDTKLVVHSQPWGTAKIVKAANIRTTTLEGPAVITCQSPTEYEQAFADDATYATVKEKPVAMATVLFPQVLAAKILKVKGAVNYQTESTAIILVRENDTEEFLKWTAPPGVFLNRQSSKLVPVWHKLREGENMMTYFTRVTAAAAQVEGRLVYRPSDNASLGVLSQKPMAADIQPRWYLQKCPEHWSSSQEVEECAKARGFQNIDGITRSSKRAWFLRADLDGLVKDQVCTFKSGIIVSLAVPRRAPVQETTAEVKAEVRDKDGDVGMANAEAPVRPPWEAYFNEKCCGGDGDCFFLMASHGIRANQSKPKQMAEKEMGPGGALQANLRMIVSATMTDNKRYPQDEARKAAKTGEWATSAMVRAAAVTTKTNFSIWKKSRTGTWTLYTAPADIKTKQTVWATLVDKHYKLLLPKAGVELPQE